MQKVLGSSWIVTVDGADTSGLQREAYCRDLYETLVAGNRSNRIQLVRIDRVASDFASTGRNWNNVRTVVEDSMPDKTVGEYAADAAFKAAQLSGPDEETTASAQYYNDAAYLLLDAFSLAEREGRLSAVVRGYSWLADNEGHRVHRLLISLKRGRQADVLDGLANLA